MHFKDFPSSFEYLIQIDVGEKLCTLKTFMSVKMRLYKKKSKQMDFPRDYLLTLFFFFLITLEPLTIFLFVLKNIYIYRTILNYGP